MGSAKREAALAPEQIEAAASEYGLKPLGAEISGLISQYTSLILTWNKHMALTGARSAMDLLQEHIFEGVFLAERVPNDVRSVLDLGSGMGIPGIPIALRRPEIAVVLAESRAKRAVFLREVGRQLGLAFEVYGGRAESLKREFDCVAMRAVERPRETMAVAFEKVTSTGCLCLFTTLAGRERGMASLKDELQWIEWRLPRSQSKILLLGRRTPPFGTEW